jgi:predicted PurR-regulated permease PerM
MKMVWVIALFSAVHALEGYVVTPLAQRRAVRLPPALTILAQLLMWEVAGLLGVALATPLTAAVIVLVKMLYLHEKPEH